jgi:hypothetical protein
MAQSSGTRARVLLQGFAKGGDGLLQPRRPALPQAERCECNAEVHLGHGPVERRAHAGIAQYLAFCTKKSRSIAAVAVLSISSGRSFGNI